MFCNDFTDKMKTLLGEEDFSLFMEAEAGPPVHALRMNPRKTGFSGTSERVPWEPLGFYYDEALSPGKHPWHEAGLYYIQDASAMAPAAFLMEDSSGPLRVLDLCAAPGGKTTQIASRLSDSDLLIANEPVPSRAAILSENVERFGLRNTIVTSMMPEALAERFPGFFDRILVDAPCSGEGMFRKNPEAIREWSPENVAMCSIRQGDILDAAALMLAPGGRLVYSTCTFSREENEDRISAFLVEHPAFSLMDGSRFSAFCGGMTPGIGLPGAVRLFPHRVKGEGHFLAVLIKEGFLPDGLRPSHPVMESSDPDRGKSFGKKAGKGGGRKGGSASASESPFRLFQDFAGEALSSDISLFREEQTILFGDQLYLLPEGAPSLQGLKVLRPGLHLGTVKKDRFEPSHALALFLSGDMVQRSFSLSSEDGSAASWIRGETFRADGEKGWYLITVDGISLGWGKLAGGTMKNHYPKGLRKSLPVP